MAQLLVGDALLARAEAALAVALPDALGLEFVDPADPLAGVAFEVAGIAVTPHGSALAAVTRASLDSALKWIDVFGMAMLAGIGFTVSLLIGELAYGPDSDRAEHVKIGVLTGSLTAAMLASIVLRPRNRHYRAVHEEESRDADLDGIPDVYQRPEDLRTD